MRALLIRTLTVGPGIPPDQPATGCGRVADCDRRCGISPPPEHAALAQACHIHRVGTELVQGDLADTVGSGPQFAHHGVGVLGRIHG